jgi:hypothetical protein
VEQVFEFPQTVKLRRNPEEVNSQACGRVHPSPHIGESGLASASVTCTWISRVVIPRSDWNRPSLEGQVARDPEGSGFGTSATSKSKGAQRDREVPSCDGTHGSCVERNTWHRAFGARRLEEQVFGIANSDTPRLTVDHRGSGFRCLIARGQRCKPRDIARSDLPISEGEIAEKNRG